MVLILAIILIIAGLALVVVGAIALIWPRGAKAYGTISGLAKLVGEVNKLLDKFDKPRRPAVFLVVVGLALIGVGAFLTVTETTAAAVHPTKPHQALRL